MEHGTYKELEFSGNVHLHPVWEAIRLTVNFKYFPEA